jgi:hypothetical protein
MGQKENRGIPEKYVIRAEKLGLSPRNQETITLADGGKMEINTNSPDSARTIGKMLSGKKILSEEEAGDFHAEMMVKTVDLGFSFVQINFTRGITTGCLNIEGYVTENEEKRKKKKDGFVEPFETRQPPDQAKKIGAEALVEINGIAETIKRRANGAREGAEKKSLELCSIFVKTKNFILQSSKDIAVAMIQTPQGHLAISWRDQV